MASIAGAGVRLDRRAAVRLAVLVVWLAASVSGCVSEAVLGDAGPVTLALGFAMPAGVGEVVSVLTTESLVRSTHDGRHEPELAERWTVDPDGLRLTLHLRPGVTFHDGTALTADVVRSFLETARTEKLQQAPMLRDVQRVETNGPLEVVLHLRQRSALLLDDLTLRITKRGADERPVGTGPFIEAERDDDARVFRANATYHGGRPRIDVVRIQIYPTIRSAWAAMMRAEIDMIFQVPSETTEFVQAESGVEVFTFIRPYVYFLGFNTLRAPFIDATVRQALNYAVNREEIIARTLYGRGRAASGTSPLHWAFQGSDAVYRYDPGRADQLLAQSGHPPLERRADRPAADLPARLRFVCLVPSDLAPFEMLALQIQKQLYDVGVDMQVEAVPTAELVARIPAGNYEAVLLWRNTGQALSRLYSSWHSAEPDGWAYRSVDDVLERLRVAPTEAALRDAAAELQRTFYEDPPAIFIADREDLRAVSTRFEIPDAPGQDIIETIWQWQPAATGTDRRGRGRVE